MNNVTIGADIEVFLYDKITKKYISAIGIINGTKKEPLRLTANGFAISQDNVLAEFNIEPANSANDFVKNVTFMLQHIQNVVGDMISVRAKASAHFTQDQFNHPAAMEFGCDPDWDVYSGTKNTFDQSLAKNSLRSAGFHIHVGYPGKNNKTSENIIKMMDLLLGVPSVIIDPDKERKKLYGKAGAYRYQPWGVEYRVLSGFFASSPTLIGWCYNMTIEATRRVFAGWTYESADMLRIVAAINENDVVVAEKLMKKYKIEYPQRIKQLA